VACLINAATLFFLTDEVPCPYVATGQQNFYT
jgi:hypothetical protein